MAYEWEKIALQIDDGSIVEAIAPEILSVSRATDIPAFHAEWFINRLRIGYCKWNNPFNRQTQYVSFSKTKAIVFWTKNPSPLLPYLHEFERKKIAYYFLYTLNDFEAEGFEPYIPPLATRIETFANLSQKLGTARVHWRFDPVLLSDSVTIPVLQKRIQHIGNTLAKYTDKLIFSFIDIEKYQKVKRNIKKKHAGIRELTTDEKYAFASFFQEMLAKWRIINPQFTIASCAQEINLEPYGIIHNACIDRAAFASFCSHDSVLMKLLGYEQSIFGLADRKTPKQLKDPGQRKACNCIKSKDIGQYNTCPHGCVYCYANTSPQSVLRTLYD